MAKVLVAGSVMSQGWPGGEPQTARQVALGLAGHGFEVDTSFLPREGLALAGLVASPLDWDPVAVGFYRKVLERSRPDVVLGFYDHDTSLCEAAVRAKIPFVQCVHIHWPICPSGILYIDGEGACSGPRLSKCLRHMSNKIPDAHLPHGLSSLPAPIGLEVYAKFRSRRRILSRASAIIVPSRKMANLLDLAGYGRLRVVPSGIETTQWPFSFEDPETPPIVLLPAAASSERKGLAEFRELARMTRSAHPALRFVATNFGGDSLVEGTPYLSHEALVRLVGQSTVVVVPSLWDEPFGLVLLEAMSVGRPVVAYDTGAASEIIESGKTGLVVPKGDRTALSSAVERLLVDPGSRRIISEAARLRVDSFYTVRHMVNRYVSVVSEFA